jgi:hypothetical protein
MSEWTFRVTFKWVDPKNHQRWEVSVGTKLPAGTDDDDAIRIIAGDLKIDPVHATALVCVDHRGARCRQLTK